MRLSDRLEAHRAEVLAVAGSHGARNVRVFGSVARGDDSPSSDIDLLVDMEPGRSLLDLAALHADLNALLGVKVDVLTEKGVYWLIRRRVLREAKPL